MPTADPADRLVRRHAELVADRLCSQERLWDRGFTRRKFLAGAGMASVAALGSQLVTTKVAYADTLTSNGNTLISVFLRGAADGLRVLIPASSALGVDYLRSVRPALVPADSAMLPLAGSGGWALNAAMAALLPFWGSGELAFVPAVSAPNVSRSHFQAQQSLDRGGSDTYSTGWLDRALGQLGPGSTFRAVAEHGLPASLSGGQGAVVMDTLSNFVFPGGASLAPASEQAITGLYRGLDGPLAQDAIATIAAIDVAAKVRSAGGGVQNGAVYPAGAFSDSLRNLATMIRGGAGLQVATVDVGGWDTHTNEAPELDQSLASASATLAAFLTDLGPAARSKVTVVVMTEFGRRVAMNASGGTDHGHGSVMWLLGGGLSASGVYGNWTKLTSSVLDLGDVPGLNNAYDVLGELVQTRLGAGSLASVFPGHKLSSIGVARAG